MVNQIREYESETGTYFMYVMPDKKGCLDTEEKEFQDLMKLSVRERADALKEEVILSRFDFDSCLSNDYVMRAPYIVRFSGEKLSTLLQSLPEADQIDLLTMPVKEKFIRHALSTKTTVYRKKRNYLQELVMKLPETEQEKILRHDQRVSSFFARMANKVLEYVRAD